MKQIKPQLFLVLMMALYALPVTAYDFEVDGIYYLKNGSNAVVTYQSYPNSTYPSSTYSSDYTGDVVIPSTVTYNGTTYTVTKIAARAFLSCTMIITIHVGENVQYIEDGAFEGCSSLTHIYIPSTLVNMGTGCFAGCSNLGGIDYYAIASEIISKTIEYDEGVETIVVIIEFWNDYICRLLSKDIHSVL